MFTINAISAEKTPTAPGMYIIEAEATVSSDKSHDTFIVSMMDNGAEKEYVVASQHYDTMPTEPEYLPKVFKALSDVIRILDNN